MGGPFHGGRGGGRNNGRGGGNGGGGGGGRRAGGGGGGRGGGGSYNNHNNNRNQGSFNSGGGNRNNHQRGGGGGRPGDKSSQDVLKTLLKLFFEKNGSLVYNSDTAWLTLNNLAEADDFAAIKKSIDFNSRAFAEALVSAISEAVGPNIVCLRLERNNIKYPENILYAFIKAGYDKSVALLSLENNAITNLSCIKALKGFPNLRQLSFAGNPEVQRIGNYRKDLLKAIPQLQYLDGNAIEHRPLSLVNPIPAQLSQQGISLLQGLESNLFTQMRNPDQSATDATASFYNANALLSVTRCQEVFPNRLIFDAQHNSADFEKSLCNAMEQDFRKLRDQQDFRNLSPQTPLQGRVQEGQRQVAIKLRGLFAGTGCRSISTTVQLNGNANVVALETFMKVPVYVLTVHGSINFCWNPRPAQGGDPSTLPFWSVLFDRTMTLASENGQLLVANDMLNLRPNPTVIDASGNLVEPLFFANSAAHLQRLQRNLSGPVPLSVLHAVAATCLKDSDIVERAEYILRQPPDVQERCAASPEFVAEFIQKVLAGAA